MNKMKQNNKTWLKEYFEMFQSKIIKNEILDDLNKIKISWEHAHSKNKKVIFVGNGGSAAMASHCSVDLTKNAGIKAINFNEADLITCFSNDYGYEEWVSKAIEFYGNKGDVVVLISSSGKSKNMLRAAETAKKLNIGIITFTGFNADNPLRKLGEINLWVDSHAYNIVEMTHHIWILAIVDLIIGSSEYPA